MSLCLEVVLPAIMSLHPTWSEAKAEKYAEPICVESSKRDIDPLIAVAIIWHETGYRNRLINRNKNGSADYGLMQFNCATDIHMKWRKRLCARRARLLTIRGNISAGFQELEFWKKTCIKKHAEGVLLSFRPEVCFACSSSRLVPKINRGIINVRSILNSHWWVKHYNWNSKIHWLSVLYIYRVLLEANDDYYVLVNSSYYRRLAKSGKLRSCILRDDLCLREFKKWRQKKNSKRRLKT